VHIIFKNDYLLIVKFIFKLIMIKHFVITNFKGSLHARLSKCWRYTVRERLGTPVLAVGQTFVWVQALLFILHKKTLRFSNIYSACSYAVASLKQRYSGNFNEWFTAVEATTCKKFQEYFYVFCFHWAAMRCCLAASMTERERVYSRKH